MNHCFCLVPLTQSGSDFSQLQAPTFADVLGAAGPDPSAPDGNGKGKGKGNKGNSRKKGKGKGETPPVDGANPGEPNPVEETTPLMKAKALSKSVLLSCTCF